MVGQHVNMNAAQAGPQAPQRFVMDHSPQPPNNKMNSMMSSPGNFNSPSGGGYNAAQYNGGYGPAQQMYMNTGLNNASAPNATTMMPSNMKYSTNADPNEFCPPDVPMQK